MACCDKVALKRGRSDERSAVGRARSQPGPCLADRKLAERGHRAHGSVTQAFTSQLYFAPAVSNAVFAQGVYAARGSIDTTNARDQLFDQRMIVPLRSMTREYAGAFTFAMRTTA